MMKPELFEGDNFQNLTEMIFTQEGKYIPDWFNIELLVPSYDINRIVTFDECHKKVIPGSDRKKYSCYR